MPMDVALDPSARKAELDGRPPLMVTPARHAGEETENSYEQRQRSSLRVAVHIPIVMPHKTLFALEKHRALTDPLIADSGGVDVGC